MDDPIYDIELEDCPICRGAGLIQDEQGWSVSVACVDCGAETWRCWVPGARPSTPYCAI